MAKKVEKAKTKRTDKAILAGADRDGLVLIVTDDGDMFVDDKQLSDEEVGEVLQALRDKRYYSRLARTVILSRRGEEETEDDPEGSSGSEKENGP